MNPPSLRNAGPTEVTDSECRSKPPSAQLAELVNTPVEKLLEQLAEAGMSFSGPDQVVTSTEKMKLLGFLQPHARQGRDAAAEGADAPKKITPQPPQGRGNHRRRRPHQDHGRRGSPPEASPATSSATEVEAPAPATSAPRSLRKLEESKPAQPGRAADALPTSGRPQARRRARRAARPRKRAPQGRRNAEALPRPPLAADAGAAAPTIEAADDGTRQGRPPRTAMRPKPHAVTVAAPRPQRRAGAQAQDRAARTRWSHGVEDDDSAAALRRPAAL
mgnify:CR=1 FL=1